MTFPENDDSKRRMKGSGGGTKAQRTILRKQEYKLINALYLTESKTAPGHVRFPVVQSQPDLMVQRQKQENQPRKDVRKPHIETSYFIS